MLRNPTTHSMNGDEAGARQHGERSIFRAEALEHYTESQKRTIFPRLVSPRSFRILWAVAVLFLVAGLLIAFWPLIGPLLAGAQ